MIAREAEHTLISLANQFRAVALVGPRQSGKSTLAKKVFSDKPYVSLENPEIRNRAMEDPKGFLHHYAEGAIIDEAHRVPVLFNYLQQVLDESTVRGKFILTGSNNFLMIEKITQSLAGRIGYIDLMPFSLKELASIKGYPSDVNHQLFKGGYPAVTYEKIEPKYWFPAYVRTYIERDVRQIKNITDLATFQRFMFLCASRIGQQLNLSNLGVECGIDHKTAQSWISVMQASYIIHLLPSYHKNFSKRIIKSPKLYFCDTGLACYLLGIESETSLATHSARGALFENMMITELLKNRLNKGLRSNLFYWRDVSGHELDLIIDKGTEGWAVEIKSGMTMNTDYYKGLLFWNKISGTKGGSVLYTGNESYKNHNGIHVIGWREVNSLLDH